MSAMPVMLTEVELSIPTIKAVMKLLSQETNRFLDMLERLS